MKRWFLYRTRVGRWWLCRTLCLGCGKPKKDGVHGYFSEYGGCV